MVERLHAAGMTQEAGRVLDTLDPQELQRSVRRETYAKKDKPKDVERYYRDCRKGDKAKGMGEKDAAAYCSSVAWSIYCKYKNPGSPSCKKKEYLKGK